MSLEARIELGTQILRQRRVFKGVDRHSCVDVSVPRGRGEIAWFEVSQWSSTPS